MEQKQIPENGGFKPSVLTPGNYSQIPAIPPELAAQPVSFNTQQNNGRRFSLNINKGLAALAVVLVIVIGTAGFLAYENSRAASLLNAAKASLSSKEYDEALQQLNQASQYYSLGSTKHQISALSKQAKAWVADNNYYKQAGELYKQGKYSESAAILAKIGSDFPDYKQIKALSDQISQLVSQPAQTAKPPISKPVPVTTSPLAQTTAPVAGKRFVSTTSLSALSQAATVTQAQQVLESFLSQYGMHVEITNISQSSYAKQFTSYKTVAAGDLGELKSYGALFIDEWSKYPKDWVQNSGVKDIILVTNFAVQGTLRAAMPDVGGYDMYYDIGYAGDYAREVVHHEYDHLITYHYFNSFVTSDTSWLSLNPPGFSYGNGGASCYQPGNSCLTGEHPIPGFVTGYAASAIEEDQAELYAYLMETTYYHHLQSWLPGDQYLTKKVSNYKQFIASHSPEMSGGYFDQINP